MYSLRPWLRKWVSSRASDIPTRLCARQHIYVTPSTTVGIGSYFREHVTVAAGNFHTGHTKDGSLHTNVWLRNIYR